MPCSEGHSDWISTTNGACFATSHGFQSCTCPISTCVHTSGPNGGYYSCEFTYLSYFLIFGLLAALIALSVSYYLYVTKKGGGDGRKRVAPIVDWQLYNDRMFGVYHANGDSNEDKESGGANSGANSPAKGGKQSPPTAAAASASNAADTERKGLLGGASSSYGSTSKK